MAPSFQLLFQFIIVMTLLTSGNILFGRDIADKVGLISHVPKLNLENFFQKLKDLL